MGQNFLVFPPLHYMSGGNTCAILVNLAQVQVIVVLLTEDAPILLECGREIRRGHHWESTRLLLQLVVVPNVSYVGPEVILGHLRGTIRLPFDAPCAATLDIERHILARRVHETVIAVLRVSVSFDWPAKSDVELRSPLVVLGLTDRFRLDAVVEPSPGLTWSRGRRRGCWRR